MLYSQTNKMNEVKS